MKAKSKKGVKKSSKLKAKKSNGVTSKDKNLASMSVDQFFAAGLDSDDEGEMEAGNGVDEFDDAVEQQSPSGDEDDAEEQGASSSEEDEIDEEQFQQSLDKLKDTDPEFYKFLQENDKDVLQNIQETEKPPANAEDDEMGSEGGDISEDGDSVALSLAQLAGWEAALNSHSAKSALKEVTMAFREAVARVSSGATAAQMDDPNVFNALVRLCLNEVPRAVAGILKLESADRDPSKNKRWIQVKGPVKRFLTDVIQLLHSAGSAGMQRALLRHLLSMTSYLATEPRLCSGLVSRLVALWSTGEHEVRVLAFLNLYRLTKRCQATLLDTVLMKTYLAYVKNCSFTSASSWPDIHLMRRSLVELYRIDPAVSYQRAFLYIRQLAIHLRNAKLDKKKFQVVYNWQYVHCLLLWSALLSEDHSDDLKLLLYPLVQIMLGTVSLIPISRHYPLRFHITRALTQISATTGTFIPVLPLLLQVLHQTDFNKRNTRLTKRPLDLSCMLRFSAAELKENGFRDGVFDALMDGLMEYLHVECCTLAFPELVVLARLQLRDFVKTSKVRAYGQRMKELLDKIKAQCDALEARRQTLPYELSDHEAVRRWEQERRAESTPFAQFYANWRQKQEQKSKSKPKDGKISVQEGPAAEDGSDAEASDDEVQPFDDSEEDAEDVEEEADDDLQNGEDAGPDLLQPLDSESEEVEDEGDTVVPLQTEKKKTKKKQKKKKQQPASSSQKKVGTKRRHSPKGPRPAAAKAVCTR